MLVTTEKLKVEKLIENACPKCDGAGKVYIVPATGNKFFKSEMECSHCNGEKVITQDLLDRKSAGANLRSAMREADLTLRESAKKFNGSFSEWNDAVQGRVSVKDIRAKIELVKGF